MFNVKWETVVPISDLARHLYRFDLVERPNHLVVRLCYYAHETRPTTRHKWRANDHWDGGWDQRSNTCDKPVVPLEMWDEACQTFAKFIRPEEVAA